MMFNTIANYHSWNKRWGEIQMKQCKNCKYFYTENWGYPRCKKGKDINNHKYYLSYSEYALLSLGKIGCCPHYKQNIWIRIIKINSNSYIIA